MKIKEETILEVIDTLAAIRIKELKEEIEHLKTKFEKIQEIIAFDHELAKEVKKIIEEK